MTKFSEDVLDAAAALDRLCDLPLVRVDYFDTIAMPADRDGYVSQCILARGRSLVLGHLLGARLVDIDYDFAIEMTVADLGGA
jgi:hypothetical protein